MASIVFLILFIIDMIIHLVIIPQKDDHKQRKLTLLTKPFLMPLLIFYYTIDNPTINILILIGVILGWIGDVTLIFPKIKVCFLIGLASFLIGHILYIIAFIKVINFDQLSWVVFLSLLVYGGFFIIVWRYLQPSLGEMKIPVLIYMSLIITMSFFSLCIWQSPVDSSIGTNWLPFIGSFFFMASDTMLANQLFKKPFKNDQVHIMWTYIFAQFCIAQAFIL